MTTNGLFPPEYGMVITPEAGPDLTALDKAWIVEKFREKKVLLFRGFKTDSGDFCRFTENFGAGFFNYEGGAYDRKQINGQSTLLSVTNSEQKFRVPFHGEMHYKKIKPDLLWFYCETPPIRDGETTLCDGQAICESLRSATRDLFTKKRIKYIRRYPNDSWKSIFKTEDPNRLQEICTENELRMRILSGGEVETEYLAYAIVPSPCGKARVFINNIMPIVAQEFVMGKNNRVRMEDDRRIPWLALLNIWRTARKLERKVPWQKGDILMIDNLRLMHGRKRITDSQRNILTRLCMADFPMA